MLMLAMLFRLCLLAEVFSYRDRVLKFYYFRTRRGILMTVDGSFDHGRFIVDSGDMILDLVEECYVLSVHIALDEEGGDGGIITVGIGGRSPQESPDHHCEYSGGASGVRNFACRHVTKFMMVQSTDLFIVINVTVRGHALLSERYAGCYPSSDDPGVYDDDDQLGVDLADCVVDCGTRGFALAGVKNGYCTCHSYITGNMSRADKCSRDCLEHQICDGPNHTALYLTGDVQALPLEAPCLGPRMLCNCRTGLIGTRCEYRDCTIEFGDCPDRLCYSLFELPRFGGICGCYLGVFIGGCAMIPDGEAISSEPRMLDGIDECLHKTHMCDPVSSSCRKTRKSYMCVCKNGFRAAGSRTCNDIDECHENPTFCAERGPCSNTPGSFACFCQNGFQHLDGICQDIDECSVRPEKCADRGPCMNTIGLFQCRCPLGFKFVEEDCQDVDECETLNPCGSEFQCQNSPGCYACLCMPGMEFHPLCQKEHEENSYSTLMMDSTTIESRVSTSVPVYLMILLCAIIAGLCIVCAVRYRKRKDRGAPSLS